jgi:hypothetical protein
LTVDSLHITATAVLERVNFSPTPRANRSIDRAVDIDCRRHRAELRLKPPRTSHRGCASLEAVWGFAPLRGANIEDGMSRPDQSITYLKTFGYSVFRVPRHGAQPLQLLHRDGKDLTRLGGIADLVDTGAVAVPDIHRDDRPGVNIEGVESSKVNASIGLNILGGFIGALGGGNLGLQAGFNRARTVTFAYAAVTEDSIDVLALERFVKGGRISEHVPSGTIDKLIDDEVIVVSAQGDAGQSVQVDVPVIQQAVGGSVTVGTEASISSRVTFEGSTAIPFAFQAVQLVFDPSGQFLTTEQLPAGEAAARELGVGVGTSNRVFLAARGAFVRLAD